MKNFLYEEIFRHTIYGIHTQIHKMMILFEKIAGEKIVLFDKYALIYTQLKLVSREIEILINLVDKIYNDFKD